MNDQIDEKIRAALRGSRSGDELADEPNLAEELITAFRGRNRWITVLGVLVGLGSTALFVWAGLRFYEAAEVRDQLIWGGWCFVALMFMSFMKVWFWLEMHSNRVLREVKRVELLLLRKLGESED